MKKENYYCDLCGTGVQKQEKRQPLQVIFTTDQEEGRSCDPYITFEDLDICPVCMNRVLQGVAIYGQGAMGHNKYFFK